VCKDGSDRGELVKMLHQATVGHHVRGVTRGHQRPSHISTIRSHLERVHPLAARVEIIHEMHLRRIYLDVWVLPRVVRLCRRRERRGGEGLWGPAGPRREMSTLVVFFFDRKFHAKIKTSQVYDICFQNQPLPPSLFFPPQATDN
jgi:hypothetical protein